MIGLAASQKPGLGSTWEAEVTICGPLDSRPALSFDGPCSAARPTRHHHLAHRVSDEHPQVGSVARNSLGECGGPVLAIDVIGGHSWRELQWTFWLKTRHRRPLQLRSTLSGG